MKSCRIRPRIAQVLAVAAAVVLGLTGAALPPSQAVQATPPPPQPAKDGSYARVAPILQSQCASCHNPQGGGPFNLLTYEDAKQWGGQILDVTQSRYMPPWLPAPGKGDFAGARRLSDAELASIRAWVGAGMPAGSNAETTQPVPPQPEWQLGKPDAVLTLAEPVELAGNGPDLFTNLIVPYTGGGAHRLRAIEIRPSDPQAVRSVWLTFDEAGKLQQANGWKQGIAEMEPPVTVPSNAAGLVFWSAGSQALKPRPGETWAVQPGSDLLLTTHLKTTGKKLALQMQIGLYYESPTAKARTSDGSAIVLPLQHRGAIDIPAGSASTVFEDTYTLAQPAQVAAIYPRAHFLARSFDAYAITPAGKQIWLLSIPKWDVDWLEVYAYRRPVLLAKGSVIHWKVIYDNSAENPHNPSDPPAAVHGGVDAKEEADGLYLELLPPTGVKAAAWRKTFAGSAP